MVIAHDKSIFAFEFDIHKILDSKDHKWVYGSFLLWIQGKRIGNPNDYTALDACYSWILDFDNLHMHTDTHEFSSLSAIEIMTLYNQYCRVDNIPVKSIVNRYHEDIEYGIYIRQQLDISEFGMTSFDNVTLLMLDYDLLCKRIIMQQFSVPPIEFVVQNKDILTAIDKFKILYANEVARKTS